MRRVVLLGASNLTVSFPLVLESLQAGSGGPLDVLAAHGHGRSYGNWSRVLVRALPGIAGCDLWRDLAQRAEAEDSTQALVTDVGNDLLYGATVSTILGWVETCLERLTEHRAEIVLTLLPLVSVERLSVWRYELTRMLFFPRSGIPLAAMLESARELNDHLHELGRKFDVRIIDPPGNWYGFDPIHIRHSRRVEAWRQIFSGWPSWDKSTRMARASLGRAYRLWRLPPADRRLFGRRQKMPQPTLQVGQTSVSLY